MILIRYTNSDTGPKKFFDTDFDSDTQKIFDTNRFRYIEF